MLNQASGGTGRVDPESRQHLSSGTGVCFGLAVGSPAPGTAPGSWLALRAICGVTNKLCSKNDLEIILEYSPPLFPTQRFSFLKIFVSCSCSDKLHKPSDLKRCGCVIRRSWRSEWDISRSRPFWRLQGRSDPGFPGLQGAAGLPGLWLLPDTYTPASASLTPPAESDPPASLHKDPVMNWAHLDSPPHLKDLCLNPTCKAPSAMEADIVPRCRAQSMDKSARS